MLGVVVLRVCKVCIRKLLMLQSKLQKDGKKTGFFHENWKREVWKQFRKMHIFFEIFGNICNTVSFFQFK